MPNQTQTLGTLQKALEFMNTNRGKTVTYVEGGKARSVYIDTDGMLMGVGTNDADDAPVNKTWKHFLKAAVAGPVGPFTATL